MLAVWLIFITFFLIVGYTLYDCFSVAEKDFGRFFESDGYSELENVCVLNSKTLFHRKRILALVVFIAASIAIVSTILSTEIPVNRVSNPRHIEEVKERRTKQASTTEVDPSYAVD